MLASEQHVSHYFRKYGQLYTGRFNLPGYLGLKIIWSTRVPQKKIIWSNMCLVSWWIPKLLPLYPFLEVIYRNTYPNLQPCCSLQKNSPNSVKKYYLSFKIKNHLLNANFMSNIVLSTGIKKKKEMSMVWFPCLDTLFYVWQHADTLPYFILTGTPQDRSDFSHFTGDKTATEMSLAQDHTFSWAKTITQLFLNSWFFSLLFNSICFAQVFQSR